MGHESTGIQDSCAGTSDSHEPDVTAVFDYIFIRVLWGNVAPLLIIRTHFNHLSYRYVSALINLGMNTDFYLPKLVLNLLQRIKFHREMQHRVLLLLFNKLPLSRLCHRVCAFVCQLAGRGKNDWMDFDETWWELRNSAENRPVKFGYRST